MAPDSYSRKLGLFKATWRGIEGNRRLSGMFPVTFFFLVVLIFCLFVWVGPFHLLFPIYIGGAYLVLSTTL